MKVCMMCGRDAEQEHRKCQTCGGFLMVEPVEKRRRYEEPIDPALFATHKGRPSYAEIARRRALEAA